jgi:acyl carrier protein
MTREEVYVLLNDIFRDVLADDGVNVGDETTAEDVPGWDSVAQIDVLAAAEVRFGIEIRAAEAERLGSVGDLVDLILEKTRRLAVV